MPDVSNVSQEKSLAQNSWAQKTPLKWQRPSGFASYAVVTQRKPCKATVLVRDDPRERSRISHRPEDEMRHLFISSPAVAVGMAGLLLFLGAAWWIVMAAFFLTAPVMIGVAVLLCNTILPCDPENRSRRNL